MKRQLRFALALTLIAALLLPLAACDGSSSKDSDSSEKEEQVEEEKGPETRVNNRLDCDAEFVSLDENGITFNLSMSHQNITVYPKSFEVAGNSYSFLGADENLNPEVHLRVDDSEKDNIWVDIQEGETHKVHVAIDGVTDYTHFKMIADNTVYTEGDHWPMTDVSIEFVTE